MEYLFPMRPVIIVHHHEITLKGNNRQAFERQLMSNVRRAVADLIPPRLVRGGYGRFVLRLENDTSQEPIIERLTRVFGLSNICTGVEVEQSVEAFTIASLELLRDRTPRTLKVDTRRPDKQFPIRSMEVNERVGATLCDAFHARADMTAPEETVFIEIVDGTAFVYRSKLYGAGGLPTGVSGRVVSLLSAGFDSPVASWQIMKRGTSVIFLHFHSMPYTTEQSVGQVRQIVERLTRFQFKSKLYLVPFAEIQQEIVAKTPPPMRVILYRRMMVRIAEAVARREKAEALVTGDAVGQVASQTLRNIRAINNAATYPILRPLAGMDKEETMVLARKIGTYDISKEPYDDCCSFLAPRRPETWANLDAVENAEQALNVDELATTGLRAASLEQFAFPPLMEEEAVASTPS
jgi:thiamine biosynthesis protein ThiI